MAGIDVPEMYYLAVALDLGISGRDVTREDARAWVEKLMRDRVAELHTQLGTVLESNMFPKKHAVFAFSFGVDDEDEEDSGVEDSDDY